MASRLTNPFSPDFGRPPRFFGRTHYTDILRKALQPGPQANRSLLIEGLRGTGKTALLCHFEDMAKEMGWEVVSVTSEGAANEVVHDIAKLDSPRTLLGASFNVVGFGASITMGKASEPWAPTARQALLDHLDASGKGVLLLVDEAQKLDAADAQALSDALNAAKNAGHDVAMIMAGLPGSHNRIKGFPRCTYMARSTAMRLSPLTIEETVGAIDESFALVPRVSIDVELRRAMAAWTTGNPYLIQLVGYAVCSSAERAMEAPGCAPDRGRRSRFTVTSEMLEDAEEYAYASYANKVLDLVFRRLGEGTRAYLRALAATMDEDGVMTSDESLAKALGKPMSSISSYRTRLIASGVLRSPKRGKLCFTIPYIPRYLEEGESFYSDEAQDDSLFFPIR